MKRPVLALVLSLAALAACGSGNRPASSSDQPRVVFLGVEGARDPRVNQRVEELIARRFAIIDKDTYMDTARELGAEKITRKNLAKVTSELGAVALVHGSAKGKSAKRQSVTIFVREPDRAKIVERYKLSVRKGVLAKKSDRALSKRLLASVKPPKKKKGPPSEPKEPASDEEAVAEKDDEPVNGKPKDEKKTAARKDDDEAEDADEPDPAPAVEYDDSGQAIDDEVPPM